MAITGEIVEAAQRQRRALLVAFAGVVEDEVEDDPYVFLVENIDGIAQFLHPAGHDAGVERHEGNGIVTPTRSSARAAAGGVRRSRRRSA